MIAAVALLVSLLALSIALWAWRKAHRVAHEYEEQMAASLTALLDEWENENRRFVEELERLQRQWVRSVEAASPPAAETVRPTPTDNRAEAEPAGEEPPASPFQKLLEEVLELKKAGKTDAEIARQMNRGVGEIQFILQSAAFQQKKRP